MKCRPFACIADLNCLSKYIRQLKWWTCKISRHLWHSCDHNRCIRCNGILRKCGYLMLNGIHISHWCRSDGTQTENIIAMTAQCENSGVESRMRQLKKKNNNMIDATHFSSHKVNQIDKYCFCVRRRNTVTEKLHNFIGEERSIDSRLSGFELFYLESVGLYNKCVHAFRVTWSKWVWKV